jgi:hypothetical protein
MKTALPFILSPITGSYVAPCVGAVRGGAGCREWNIFVNHLVSLHELPSRQNDKGKSSTSIARRLPQRQEGQNHFRVPGRARLDSSGSRLSRLHRKQGPQSTDKRALKHQDDAGRERHAKRIKNPKQKFEEDKRRAESVRAERAAQSKPVPETDKEREIKEATRDFNEARSAEKNP